MPRIRPSGRPAAVQWLLRADIATQALYVVLLVAGTRLNGTLRDAVLAQVALLLPAAVAAARGVTIREDRVWSFCFAAAALSFALGNIVYLAWVAHQAVAPYPSYADVGYLGFFPFAVAGVALSLRARMGRVRRSVALDGVVALLAAATVGAWVVTPLAHTFEGSLAQVVVSLSYPAGDVLLMAMAVGVLVVGGRRDGGLYVYLIGGLAAFVVADTVYAYRVAFGAYEVGTPLDALWALGLALVAHGVWRRRPPRSQRPEVGLGSLWVVGLAALVGLGALTVGVHFGAPAVVQGLAALTLLAAMARTVEAFLRVRDLAAVRLEARTDELTGIPNRRAFYEEAELALSAASPEAVLTMALLDLDRFKEVNDSLGHHAGDHLLTQLTARLVEVLEPGEFLARLGGDEFAVLAPGIAGEDAVETLGRRLRAVLVESFPLAGLDVHVHASIGIALAPDHATTRSGLMRCADEAMYAGKRIGVPVTVYEVHQAENLGSSLHLAEDLYRGVRDGQLRVLYQPKVDLRGVLRGAEALVRWQHPQLGLLTPDRFLPVAEDHKLMPALTRAVLDTALADVSRWGAEGLAIGVAVNLSAADLLDDTLPPAVADALSRHRVPAQLLTLEITETTMMADPQRAEQTLGQLRALGVELSVDDYGTGHCSLAYLRRLPVQELKLDRSFVRDAAHDGRDSAIVESTVQLARALGLRLVAEGVEDADCAELLAGLGADLAQGWHFGRPMPAADLLAHSRAASAPDPAGVPVHG